MEDVIIIGAGPIGLACGIGARQYGLRYRIIEKGVLVNSLYHYPDKMTFFSTSDKLEIGGVPFVSHNAKPTRQEALEYYRRVAEKYDLAVQLYEELKEIRATEEGHFLVKTSRGNYRSRKVVIATGFYDLPNRLQVPGEYLPKVHHYYKDPHPYFRQKVAVIGARNSAVDAALECWRKGADVTMIIRGEALSERVKYWVKPDIENRIKEGSIPAYFNAEVRAIHPGEIEIIQQGKSITLANDFVLAMTGYRPDYQLLQDAGVELADTETLRPQYDSETMETNVAGLYLAGVICGGMETHKWIIENSRVHASVIMDHINQQVALQQ